MPKKEITVDEYHEILKKFAPKIGLIFNPDPEIVMPLVAGLLANKNRYGYPSCPCRLACGEYDNDKDIICPCDYARPDIEEFGKCYCELYVNQDFIDGKIPNQRVPERRPMDKLC